MTIVILGAGPAGLAAAEAASANGQRVLVVDENFDAGGQIWRGGPREWTDPRAQALWQALRTRPHVEFIGAARVVAARDAHTLLLEQQGKARTLTWSKLIVCSGARELLLPFPGWTLPGVTGAGGLQALAKGGMVLTGKRIVIAGSGPLLLAAAHTAVQRGAVVLAIAEQRSTGELARFLAKLALRHQGKFFQAARLFTELQGIPYLHGASVSEALGMDRLSGVRLQHKGRSRSFDCDLLACGYGLTPNLESAAMLECLIDKGCVQVDALQASSRANVWAAGEATGIGGVDKALIEGRIAGLAASGQTPMASELRERTRAHRFATLLAHSFAPPLAMRDMCRPSTVVCRCEDVRAAQLAAHTSWRSAKLQTRVGMGPCQGRVCGAACEFLFGWEQPGLRQPVFPATAATLACVATKDDPA